MPICTIHTILSIQANSNQYISILALLTFGYIQIHSNTSNTYQTYYIPIHAIKHTMSIHTNLFHNTHDQAKHSSTYN